MSTKEKKNLDRWDALVETFRSFGGIANNVIQREGALGLGLFPIDSSQPVELRVPDYLLVATNNLELRNGAVTIKDASLYPEGFREWYEGFQADYSWGAEARHSIKSFENGLRSFSDSLKQKLKNIHLLDIEKRCPGINEEEELFRRFIATRRINYRGENVLMPMIELVNHSPTQSSWALDKDSIAIQGQYDGEILVRYSASDPLRRYLQYGFNCKETLGFSLEMKLKHRGQEIFIEGGINFEPMKLISTTQKDQKIILTKPLLSSYNRPRMPKKLFRDSCKALEGINSDELFEQIHQKNRLILISLIKSLGANNTIAENGLKKCFLDQIDILGHYYGIKNAE